MISQRLLRGRILPAVLTGALLLAASASVPALGQDSGPQAQTPPPAGVEWDKKRLDRLERAVERLENTIARIKPDRAPPNLIEPDPEVVALEARADELTARIGDLESALRKVNADLDTANIDLDKSHKAIADARAANDTLGQRVTLLEAKMADMEKAQAAAAAAAAAAQTPAPDGAPGAQPSGDSAAEFKNAMSLMTNGDYTGASGAFTAFVAKWPAAPETPEAHYRLAETFYIRDEQDKSAVEYAASLQGWPRAKWAPDATVKLAQAFANIGHNKEACATLGELERHYAKDATPSVKSRAAAVKTQAKCGR
jgi:tol-pal system protein YbgF